LTVVKTNKNILNIIINKVTNFLERICFQILYYYLFKCKIFNEVWIPFKFYNFCSSMNLKLNIFYLETVDKRIIFLALRLQFLVSSSFWDPKHQDINFFLLHEMFLEFNSTHLRHLKKYFFCPKTLNYFSPKTAFFLALRLQFLVSSAFWDPKHEDINFFCFMKCS
jgi:hypothetical protein